MIKILDEKLIRKIAAGEVVERPASIVKELIENSIDANASKIKIHTTNGGENITIIDNGIGIRKVDVPLLFVNHATSKLNTFEDLQTLDSFGFRGEALASISSISKVHLRSKFRDEEYGYELIYEGGKLIQKPKTASIYEGTTIEIRDVFFNVPARKKFLKSKSTENKYIIDLINRFALANKDVYFEYIVDNIKGEFLSNDLNSIFSQITKFPKDSILNLNYDSPSLKIIGLLVLPKDIYISRKHQFVYVNGRIVQDGLILKAVKDAYREFSLKEANPSFYLNVQINPSQVDVNVHPRKTEVRFNNGQNVFFAVKKSVKETLLKKLKDTSISQITNISSQSKISEPNNLDQPKNEVVDEEKQAQKFEDFIKSDSLYDGVEYNLSSNIINVGLNSNRTKKEINLFKSTNDQDKLSFKSESKGTYFDEQNTFGKSPSSAISFSKEILTESEEELKLEKVLGIKISKYKVTQLLKSYLVCESGTSILIIDQHAASERVFFEKYMEKIMSERIDMKNLLLPEIIDIEESELQLYKKASKKLQRFGFHIEIFGRDKIKIESVPNLHFNLKIKPFFNEVINEIATFDALNDSAQNKFKKIASSYACHTAIRFGDELTQEEINTLLIDLSKCENPYNCPDGRPIIHELTSKELQKIFKRII